MDSLPKASELLQPTLKVLQKNGPMIHKHIESSTIELLSIPKNLASIIRSGNRTELAYRLSWARTKAKNLGFVERDNSGLWRITNSGITFINQ